MRYPDPAQISRARKLIDQTFLDTPQLMSAALNRQLGAEIVLKDETRNPIGCFKGRGTSFLLQTSAPPAVVAASAGNFGQGLAWSGRKLGVAVTVFASLNANPLKVEAMRALGAEVRQDGHDFDAAKEIGRAFAGDNGFPFIEDGAHPELAEGAGTIALELLQSGPEFDHVLAPLGNGALVGGLGCFLRHASPDIRLVAVGAAGAPAMGQALLGKSMPAEQPVNTIADGIAIRTPISYAVTYARQVVDEVALVEDDKIVEAMALLEDEFGLVTEPSGAVGLAAILSQRSRWAGMKVAVIVTGRNRAQTNL